jgi:hypothetical protein
VLLPVVQEQLYTEKRGMHASRCYIRDLPAANPARVERHDSHIEEET